MSVQLVSCLFDLGGDRGHAINRTIDDYIKFAGQFLLRQTDYPVLVFCDPALEPKIQQCASSKRVTTVPFDLHEDPSLAKEIAKLLEKGSCNKDRNKKKDTALYHIVGWLKPHFLQLAKQHQTEADFYCWIDFAINHVADTSNWPHALAHKTWKSDRVQTLCLNPPEKATDLVRYFQQRRYKLGGGFWIVPHGMVDTLVSEFDALLSHVFQDLKFVTLEDELLGLLAAQKPHLFRFHYGYYGDILHLDFPRHSASQRLISRNILSKDVSLELATQMYQALTANPQFVNEALFVQLYSVERYCASHSS
jgi:hypothetical protein